MMRILKNTFYTSTIEFEFEIDWMKICKAKRHLPVASANFSDKTFIRIFFQNYAKANLMQN